jgi:hypothetical protein
MVNLETLILRDVPIGDEISLLTNLSNLSYLNLRNCSLTDISVLAQLMQQGALQDDPFVGKFAYLDILENDFSQNPDELKLFAPYWENIHITQPDIINFMTLEPPEFSLPSGFYKSPIKLELFTNLKDVHIFYTLDGSNPTINSFLYTEPIQLDSLFSTTTNLPKANVIRAKIINNSGNEVSPAIAQTYFIGDYDFQSSGLPVISLVIDPKYLFDPEVGFYRTINDLERGLKWEHPAQIEFFELDGDLGFSANINTRINGVVSRKFPQKSFRIIADIDYQPENTINYALFPGNTDQIENQLITEYDTLILRNSGTEKYRTLIRDAMIQSLFQHTSLDMQSYRPSILYLNGTYWGIYNIRERIDEAYLQHHYQIPEDSVIILNLVANSGLSSNSANLNNYQDLIQYVQTNDVNDPNVYAYINEMMDIENFINYQVIEIYAANGDWPRNNLRFWKIDTDKIQSENAPGLDGRWRWILYDLDYGFLNYQQNSLSNATQEDESTILFKPLLENETFKIQLINSFADHLNTSFQPARVISEINKMADAIEPEIPKYVKRWPTMLGSTENWQNAVDEMKIFAEKRPAVLQAMLIDYFDLSGTANVFITSSAIQGYVKINSIDIIESTPGIENSENWQGSYFMGVPITLMAIEEQGYKFSHWEMNGKFFSESQSITIVPENDLHLNPIFEKIPTN